MLGSERTRSTPGRTKPVDEGGEGASMPSDELFSKLQRCGETLRHIVNILHVLLYKIFEENICKQRITKFKKKTLSYKFHQTETNLPIFFHFSPRCSIFRLQSLDQQLRACKWWPNLPNPATYSFSHHGFSLPP